MYEKILIRYGELVLKKKNRKTFIKQLADNILNIVGQKPEIEFDRMYIDYSEESLEKLKYVFGISSYSPVIVVENDIEIFKENLTNLLEPNTKTFKIAARRNNKKFFYTSNQLIIF
nr:THUMP domain-containing protein [Mycoplasmopsis cynos]